MSVSRGIWRLALVALVIVGALGDWHLPRPAAQTADPRTAWRLTSTDELLAPPPGQVSEQACEVPQPDWSLPGYTPADLASLLSTADLDPELRARLERRSTCTSRGCVVHPSPKIIEALAPSSRARLYRELGRFPENDLHFYARWRRVTVRPWSADPGLSARARALLARLEYVDGNRRLFVDFPLVCARLEGAERLRALEVLWTSDGLRARMRVTPADVGALALAWTSPGHDVRPLLEDAARSGREIDLVDLLPPLARARADTFPRPNEPPYDCGWTAAHFFDEAEPDPRAFEGAPPLAAFIARDCTPVREPERRLGDVLLFSKPDGTPIHVATYVADDIVLTKNGASPLAPWRLLRITDVMWRYRDAPVISTHRLRRMAGPSPR